jgi:hypothetical protein
MPCTKGEGTAYSGLQERVTKKKKIGNFDSSTRGLENWNGIGTPQQASQAKDTKERDVRAFRDNSMSTLPKLLKDIQEYAPLATKDEPREISAWIVFIGGRLNCLKAAWKVREEQEAEKKKKKKSKK